MYASKILDCNNFITEHALIFQILFSHRNQSDAIDEEELRLIELIKFILKLGKCVFHSRDLIFTI